MTHPMHEHCSRCRRPAPPQDSKEFMDWEATEDGLPVCPGCLTLLDEQYMDEAVMDLADEATGDEPR
ncbi:hypothetical protein R6V09_01155 [Streptomyces sp. W16]|uniref:hypothetical protein n=1 Tax=Streptomyces sp. W16 TaxID=3076631 RepID=UPI00295BC99B|nr:hypothetical protein [Streptomyces sp. W16]MDV9168751.1 hypothetical protein [Streptomyces sp. W16]